MKVNKNDIEKAISSSKQRIEDALVMRLQRIGEQFVANARSSGNYQDRTGNLRSSIGYVIVKNGLQLVGSDWVMIREGKAGIVVGKKLIEEMSRRFPTGIVLICVAGMDYAAAVESKGYDVITSSAFIAKKEFIKAIEKIKNNLTK